MKRGASRDCWFLWVGLDADPSGNRPLGENDGNDSKSQIVSTVSGDCLQSLPRSMYKLCWSRPLCGMLLIRKIACRPHMSCSTGAETVEMLMRQRPLLVLWPGPFSTKLYKLNFLESSSCATSLRAWCQTIFIRSRKPSFCARCVVPRFAQGSWRKQKTFPRSSPR